MSYILEALKKAQAERQIGSTPTIHAPTLASVPAGQGARSKRTPVMVAMAVMALAIAGLAVMLLRQQPAVGQPPAASAGAIAAVGQAPAVPAPAVAAAAPTPAVPTPTMPTPPAVPAAQAPAVPSPANAMASHGPAAAPAPAAGSAPQTAAPVMPAATRQIAAVRPAEAPQPTAAKQPDAAPAPVEEPVQALRELPEPIQRAIPQITLGGYMYSKNPADRLLLIDKVLRREGEEVAPGLVLEKLQPKQAIFGFRGYRYRVAL